MPIRTVNKVSVDFIFFKVTLSLDKNPNTPDKVIDCEKKYMMHILCDILYQYYLTTARQLQL